MTDPVLIKLRNITNIQITDGNELVNIKRILGYVHNLFSHDGNNKPSSFDPLTIIQEAKEGKSFRCVEYSFLGVALLLAYDIPARIVGLKTSDMETRDSGAGHVVLEFWSNHFKKWIMCDVQEGVIPRYDGKYLSAFELGKVVDNNLIPEYELVDDARFSLKNDSLKYTEWIHQYLYFLDTPLHLSFNEGVSEQDRLSERKLMLIPPNIIPPKMFQKIFPISAEYTTNVLEFYPEVKSTL